jgi:hypothetical protein
MRGGARPGAGRKADGRNTPKPRILELRRKWAIELLASQFHLDPHGLIAAAKMMVSYVESGA